MKNFESKVLATFPHLVNFGWFVDDMFAIIKSSLKQQFTDHLNALHPCIKFTMEDQVDNKWQC